MIFTPEHVQLIAEGRKTQTRRVCKQGEELRYMLWYNPHRLKGAEYLHGSYQRAVVYTASGRIKWLLEQEYAVQPGRGKPGAVWREDHNGNVMWALPNSEDVATFDDWTPLRIRITEIRREKLMNISHADAQAEGYEGIYISDALPYADYTNFMDAWNAINTRKGTRWQDNPLVWALTFEVVR